jgi:hypothetical protein
MNVKKFLGILLGVMLCLGFTVPAMADVFVTATIDKDKDISVLEDIEIFKTIFVTVDVLAFPEGAAEAKALINQVNEDQHDDEFGGEALNSVDPEPDPDITNSMSDNTGIVGVNQASGHMNNQANVVAVAVTSSRAFADAQASAEQRMLRNSVDAFETVSTNVVEGSILLNTGIVGLNQASASVNNQLNAVALAAGLGDGLVALAETDLGQFNQFNQIEEGVEEGELIRSNLIINSINGNHGVVGVNQSAGVFNNQANMVSISAVAPHGGIGF